MKLAIATLVACLAAFGAHAQTFTQPVKIIYPFAAGSAGDTLSRLYAERLQAEIGQPVVVENRTGASGKIALRAVKAAPPDGTTLLITPNGGMTLIPIFDANAGYDPEKDFAHVSQLVVFDFVIAVSNDIPAKNLSELAAFVRANPSKAFYGSPGAGSTLHFVGMKYGVEAKLDLKAVQYRGSTPVVTDLVAGQLPMGSLALADSLEQHKAGKLRIVGVSSKARPSFLPDMPTFREQGFDVLASGSYSLHAPAGTPPAIVERLREVAARAVHATGVKERLTAMGFVPTGTGAADLIAALREETAYWRPLVVSSGFKAED